MTPTRYVVVGAGAVGGTIGAQLTLAGRAVCLVARGAHRAAIAAEGLTITRDGQSRTVAIDVRGSLHEVGFTAGDVVVVATKVHQVDVVLAELRSVAGSDVPVVCAQNGLAAERTALRLFRNVYGIPVQLPSVHLRPGHVEDYSEPGGVLDVGRYPYGCDDLVEELCGDLVAAGFQSVPQPDVMPWKRATLLRNLGNALDAVCGWEARDSDLNDAVQAEALACYAAAGLAVVTDDEYDAHLRTFRISPDYPRLSSSSQSLARSTGSSEADYLNGEIVLLGRLHGVPTPVNEALQDMMRVMATGRERPASRSLDDVRARVAHRAVPVGR